MQIDPFASIVEHCLVPPPQERLLRSCRFAGEPEPPAAVVAGGGGGGDGGVGPREAGEPAVDPTGVFMVSLSESARNDGSNPQEDVYHTPPEHSASEGDAAAVDWGCPDGGRAVDLGRDTDVGFSVELEMTQRVDTESHLGVLNGEAEKTGTPAFGESLWESPAKRMRYSGSPEVVKVKTKEILGVSSASRDRSIANPAESLRILEIKLRLEAPDAPLGVVTEKIRESLVKSVENLKNYGFNLQRDAEICEGSSRKRKLNLGVKCLNDARIMDLEVEERDGGLLSREHMVKDDSAVNEVDRGTEGTVINKEVPPMDNGRRIACEESGQKIVERHSGLFSREHTPKDNSAINDVDRVTEGTVLGSEVPPTDNGQRVACDQLGQKSIESLLSGLDMVKGNLAVNKVSRGTEGSVIGRDVPATVSGQRIACEETGQKSIERDGGLPSGEDTVKDNSAVNEVAKGSEGTVIGREFPATDSGQRVACKESGGKSVEDIESFRYTGCSRSEEIAIIDSGTIERKGCGVATTAACLFPFNREGCEFFGSFEYDRGNSWRS
ncbi:uncharacterized protein LOC130135400 [Syzygium oleosum]|uniref:uncharacterized protein LOC130135400 n=1 Tax=Syzygium oleosum TaxID=219896 RepID=UPI0024BB9130|nr:uncharacterized protein LOC130135400 [Syzygium oleosum]